MKEERQQGESLVVSVPLSSATTVPGIHQLPTNSSNNNTSNSSTVSTIVTNQAQMQQTTMSVSSSSALPPSSSSSSTASSSASHGSLYQHLTNNQGGSQRASPIVPIGSSSLAHDSHNSSNNHTSVLQNINSGGVISAAGFHNDTSPTMLKVQYEKQSSSRLHAIQQEEAQTGRRSRYDYFYYK